MLDPEQSHHLRDVLRLEMGEQVILSDNSGYDYTARIMSLDGPVICRIEGRARGASEMCVAVTVYQAVIKGDHFDYAVQKMVETGAAAIVPYLAQRCVRRPKNPEKFVERAQRIALEAAKQCERSVTPPVGPICDFSEVLEQIRNGFTIFAYEREDRRTLRSLLSAGCPERAALIVGPEGGFAPEETEALLEAGAHAVSLGPRILRSETAAPYVLAQIDYACCTE
ncbi:MAG: 16S rRNA (uracil(1498)-N(3))-methyltransferase [Clostridia bacterium]|nr:16S rRNA (uracil(1498)-N(3))-methyltransferase [Clostridia bacterium]